MPNKSYNFLVAFGCGLVHAGLAIALINLALFNAAFSLASMASCLIVALSGAGIGSLLGHMICRDAPVNLNSISKLLFVALAIDIVFFNILILSVNTGFGVGYTLYIAILLSMMVRCACFPIVVHIAANSSRNGREIATAVSAIFTGVLLAALLYGLLLIELLNSFTLLFILTSLGTLILALMTAKNRLTASIASIVLITGVVAGTLTADQDPIRQIAIHPEYADSEQLRLIQNQHGVLHALEHRMQDQNIVVYANNRYDSQTNTRLFQNTNSIDWAYLLASLSNQNQTALLLGMNLNAWANVMLQSDKFKQITIVEKNPAYVKLISQNKDVAQMLKDKRVQLIYADPVMWLRKNPDLNVNVIAFNPTENEQIQTSTSFLRLIKSSLSPNGVTLYHSGYSDELLANSQSIFSEAHLHNNMILAFNSKIKLNGTEIRKNLCMMSDIEQQPVFKSKLDCKVAYEAVKLTLPKTISLEPSTASPDAN